MTHKVLDLFSGIGGFSLGLQNTGGFETVAFCEIEPYCHRVLNKHWKDVPIYNDIKELTYDTLQADGIEPDVITGGFPCQDISVAGKQKGIIGERSSLWSEYARLIEDVRPKWAIIENVPTLRSKGLTLVLQNLSEIGYHAEWHCIPCSAIGGLHRRDRIWIIAYPLANSRCTFGQGSIIEGENANEIGEEFTNQYQRSSSTSRDDRRTQETEEDKATSVRGTISESEVSHRTVSNSMCKGLEGSKQDAVHSGQSEEGIEGTLRSASESSGLRGEPKHIVTREQIERFTQQAKPQWTTEPKLDRVAYGIPRRVDRLRGLGNAVLPQIPQFLGECILNFEKENI